MNDAPQLQHDADGFLTGTPVDIARQADTLRQIREDVAVIRQAIVGGATPGAPRPPAAPKSAPAIVVPVAGADENAKSSPMPKGPPAVPSRGEPAPESAPLATEREAAKINRQAALPERGEKGRFVSRKPPEPDAPDAPDAPDEDEGKKSRMRRLAENIGNAVADAVKQSGQIDPAIDPSIAAAKEVAAPLARGFEIFNRMLPSKKTEGKNTEGKNTEDKNTEDKNTEDKNTEDKNTEDKNTNGGLLRRILRMMGVRFKKQEGEFKKTDRRLKGIEEKPNGGEGGGGFLSKLLLPLVSSVGRLLLKLPLVGPLITAIGRLVAALARRFGVPGIPGGKAAPSAGSKPPAGAPGVPGDVKGAPPPKPAGKLSKLAKLGRGAKGLLRRVPILGSLLMAGFAAKDIHDAETDESLTRRDKDKRIGGAVGGAAGGIGGMMAGASLGAAIGSIIPGIGTAIGGIVGGAVGAFLGDEAGQILGDVVGGWVNDLRNSDIAGKIGSVWEETTGSIKRGWAEVKAVALGTWDWVKSGWNSMIESAGETLKKGWDATTEAFGKVSDAIGKKWDGFVDAAKSGWDTVTGAFSSAYASLKELPGIGPAIKAAEEGARRLKNAAGELLDKAKDAAGNAWEAAKEAPGKAWEGIKSGAGAATNWLMKYVPQGLKDDVAHRRAMETGANYKQGNISGLDDAHTRALVASTALTESGGGNLDVVNSAGYMGRYQAGAGWLADAGLIKGGSAAVQAAMKADGFSNEYKWGMSGGMTRFLKNADNWNGGMDYGKYLASADAQDAAFRINSSKSYASLVKQGIITKDTSQDEIAGLLKARHISGEGGAIKVAKGGTGPADANGTTARKYHDDLKAGNAFTTAFTSAANDSPAVSAPPSPAPAQTPTAPATNAPPVIENAAVQVSPAARVATTSQSVPTVSAVPPVAPAPAQTPTVQTPISASNAGKSNAPAIAREDAQQDLRDRRIAHVVTGGLSA